MKRQKILVVEDEPDILEVIECNLARDGFRVVTARDGEAGLKLARAELPDAVVLDLMLPGIDGLEICRRLRADDVTRSMPIVMVTAKGEEADIVVGLGIGADDYLTKPFSPRELVARVRAVLRRAQPKETSASSSSGSWSTAPATRCRSAATRSPSRRPSSGCSTSSPPTPAAC